MRAEEKAARAKKRDRERYLKQLSAQGKELKADTIKIRRIAMYELVEAGMAAKEICKALNISKSTCYRDMDAIKEESFIAELKLNRKRKILVQ